jgi:hypothetical protein
VWRAALGLVLLLAACGSEGTSGGPDGEAGLLDRPVGDAEGEPDPADGSVAPSDLPAGDGAVDLPDQGNVPDDGSIADGGPGPDAPPPPPRVKALDASRFGLNSHNAGDDLFEAFAGIGIRWHRIDINWFDVEPVRGEYHWETIDRVLDAADRLGLSVLGVIAYTPAWASVEGTPDAPPSDPADYIGFVRQVVARYRGRLDAVSIWNEPNLRQFWSGTQRQFIDEILVPGLIAVREEVPELVTCGPELSSSGNEREDWLAPILDAAAPHIDIITHHQYDGGDTVAGRVAEIEALRAFLVARNLGHLPLWITETGWGRDSRVSESEQAEFLTGMMAAMLERPYWNKTFWYDSHGVDSGIVGPDGAPNYGVPYAAFDAYRDFIASAP